MSSPRMAAADTVTTRREADLLYASRQGLRAHPQTLSVHLHAWADRTPRQIFLAERAADASWRTLSYADARRWVGAVALLLLRHGGPPGGTLLLIDANSIVHAVLALAAMEIGIAVVPMSHAHLRSEPGLRRIEAIARRVKPGFVYIPDYLTHTLSLPALGSHPVRLLTTQEIEAAMPGDGDLPGSSTLSQRKAQVSGDTLAKILFTSGSTGEPKGVIHTQRMLCAQQQQMAQLWQFLEDKPPVLCDWLPWNHTSGGNNSFHMTLRNGGTLYIDEGKPTLKDIAQSVRNLREVSPTWYTNVPLGYAALLPYLEADAQFAQAFFRRLDLMVYGGAPLPAELWRRIDDVCRRTTGQAARWASGWGLTETCSTSTVTHFESSGAGEIGVPLPGMSLKLTPRRDLYAVAVKGPNVMPGYLDDTLRTREAFDEEGYFRTGDLVSFVDAANPDAGLRYEGRLSDEFKLGSGIWVVPGHIRSELLAHTGPLVQDIVVAGPGRERLVLFLWLNAELALRDFGWCVDDGDAGPDSLALRQRLVSAIAAYNAVHTGLSESISRACVLLEAPSAAFGELTDKGTINPHRFSQRRSELIARQYAEAAGAPGEVLFASDARKAAECR